jgi:hypothetical protein
MKITRAQLRSLILEATHDLDVEEFEEEEEEEGESESQEEKIAKLIRSSPAGFNQAKELLKSLDEDLDADYIRNHPVIKAAVQDAEFGSDVQFGEKIANDIVDSLAVGYKEFYRKAQKEYGTLYGLNIEKVMYDQPTWDISNLEEILFSDEIKMAMAKNFKSVLLEMKLHSMKPGAERQDF